MQLIEVSFIMLLVKTIKNVMMYEYWLWYEFQYYIVLYCRLLYLMSGKGENLVLDASGGQEERKHVVPQELIKTANLLFSQLETGYVWSVCEAKFSSACQMQHNNSSSQCPNNSSYLDRTLSGKTEFNVLFYVNE